MKDLTKRDKIYIALFSISFICVCLVCFYLTNNLVSVGLWALREYIKLGYDTTGIKCSIVSNIAFQILIIYIYILILFYGIKSINKKTPEKEKRKQDTFSIVNFVIVDILAIFYFIYTLFVLLFEVVKDIENYNHITDGTMSVIIFNVVPVILLVLLFALYANIYVNYKKQFKLNRNENDNNLNKNT